MNSMKISVARRRSQWTWQPPASKTWPHTSSWIENPWHETGGNGACTVREGGCGPGRNTFLEWTAIYPRTYTSRTPRTTLIITWY